LNQYVFNLLSDPELIQSMGAMPILLGNSSDFLSTRISYKLNLTGPSVNIQTACSTSLVAVHMAGQSVLNGECDMALAGGIRIRFPEKAGYLYEPGSIHSPDGYCRAFDIRAQGTVASNGAGLVVLKRLSDALSDGDHIYAIIRGSAINNDGHMKVGFTAPSLDRQADVVSEALAIADVEPEGITYVEAHGTGTHLGDPIEIAALTEAFRAGTDKRGFCAVGSVKTNIGHLDAAAGVAGLIKTALALKHKMIPPSLNFEQPNPRIDFANSPFFVNTVLRDWKTDGSARCAGVSSFGIGGTNAHVVVEESPPLDSSASSRPYHLFLVSAKTGSALETATGNLREHLKQEPDINLADAAYTLQVGRGVFSHRRMLVARDMKDAISALDPIDPSRVLSSEQEFGNKKVAFMFPGQGAQYVNMALGLCETEPTFCEQVNYCLEAIKDHSDLDLRNELYPHGEPIDAESRLLNQTAFAQLALFTIEYALAGLWMSWGVKPQAMIGHSIGEYVAACIAGVFSLDDALSLVAARAKMMQERPGGAMLAVGLSGREVKALLSEGLTIAAVNAPSHTVVSGPTELIREFERELSSRRVSCRYLQTSHAFHSPVMKPAADQLVSTVKNIKLGPPQIPYVSNLTGEWITAADATRTDYWAEHMCKPVRFADGLRAISEAGDFILLEVGPGTTLSSLARQQSDLRAGCVILSSLPHPRDRRSDSEILLTTLGQLWLEGVKPNWAEFHAHNKRRRVRMPTYPFERQRYWVGPVASPARTISLNGKGKHEQSDSADKSILLDQSESRAEGNMSGLQTAIYAKASRRESILSKLKAIITRLTGADPNEVDVDIPFFELGVDSLLLIQGSQAIRDEFGLDIPFRLMVEEVTTIGALADFIDSALPPEAFQELLAEPGAPVQSLNIQISVPAPVESSPRAQGDVEGAGDSADNVEQLFAQQLQLMREVMTQQLTLLKNRGQESRGLPSKQAAAEDLALMSPAKSASSGRNRTDEPAVIGQGSGISETEHFIPHRPAVKSRTDGLSTRQKDHLDKLISRYTERTKVSKQLTQAYRSVWADNRSSYGFNLLWKEMLYPIMAERSRGAKLWDADGNEYIDLAMGFGALLFGHSPRFIRKALDEQLKKGVHIGPQSRLAGEVAGLISELTGVERVTFCNSGTEAVMVALRIARTVTNRHKIALFAGSYHGTFDGVLARAVSGGAEQQSIPMSPGVIPNMVKDVLVLDYDDPQSLKIISDNAHELAAVLVEPVQSRRPDLQPGEFLQELRHLTRKANIALIFDEVITGFRIHAGGSQAWFNVKADLVTYGKVVGGGLPIGVVAGLADYMNAIDGGMWQYGDNSFPRALQTFFAGTFCKHPLAMAAARASLSHIKQAPALHRQLNQRADDFVKTLNRYFEQDEVPLRCVNFGSLMNLAGTGKQAFTDILTYHLLEKGVFIWEGKTMFISTAHTDEDLFYVTQAVIDSVAEMREGGFLEGPNHNAYFNSLPQKNGSSEITAGLEFAQETSAQQPSGNGDCAELFRTVAMTDAQKNLWTLTQFSEDASAAYNESIAVHLGGQLRIEALGKSIQEVVDRHDALRTTFSADGTYQHVHDALSIEVPVIDLSLFDKADSESRLGRWMRQMAAERFDLTQGPLIRAGIARLDQTRHVLVVTVHHLISDGGSFGILLHEMSELYSALCRTGRWQLPEPKQFGEYVQWRAEQQVEKMESDEAYWLSQFAGVDSIVALPADYTRPATHTYAGARESATLDKSLCADLKKLSAKQRCSLLNTLLSAFKVLVYKLTGENDIIIGLPTAGQTTSDGHSGIGYRTNLLPLRTTLNSQCTFQEYLMMVRKGFLDAIEHDNYAFGDLAKKLALPRSPGQPSFVSVAFNLDRYGSGPSFYGLNSDLEVVSNGRAKFDFFLNVIDKNGEMILDCEYRTDLYDGRTIRRWLKHYESLLRNITTKPGHALRDLRVLSEEEQDLLLNKCNDTFRQYDSEAGIHDLVEKQAKTRPDAVAVTSREGQISYREMDEKANQIARYLRDRGAGPEQNIGICLQRGVEMIVWLLGIMKSGAVYVPLDAQYPEQRLAYMIKDAGVKLVVTTSEQAKKLSECVEEGRAEVIEVEREEEEIGKYSRERVNSEAGGSNLAYVMYTSGSTGEPKGVSIPHRAINRLVTNTNYIEVRTSDVIAQAATTSFDAATFEIWGALVNGAKVVVVRKEEILSGEGLAGRIEEEGITTMFLTTALFNQMAKERKGVMGRLRNILFGGEMVDVGIVRRVMEEGKPERLIHVYGPTESTTFATWYEVERGNEKGGSIPIGRGITSTRVYIMDEGQEMVPVGVRGELCIGGEGLARGYYGSAEMTAEKFVPNHFSEQDGARLYRTGDISRWTAEYEIDFLGRRDEQVKIRGYRIEPGEIEAALMSHDQVADAVVMARDEGASEKRLIGYIVGKGGELNRRQIKDYLSQKLPDYMLPSELVILDRMPLTANGKVDRKALPSPDQSHYELEGTYVAPSSPVEEILVNVWAQVLGLERVGVRDDFLALGGDSILSLQIVAQAAAAGVKISATEIFEQMTIESLARVAEVRQDLPLDSVLLTSAQQVCLDSNGKDLDHLCHEMEIQLDEQLDPALMLEAVKSVVEYHDMFQLRLNKQARRWEKLTVALDENLYFRVVDLTGVSLEGQEPAIRGAKKQLRKYLNVNQGPSLVVGQLNLADGSVCRLVVLAHRLMIDGPSWGILMKDLQTAYAQLERGEKVKLGARSISFTRWARQLTDGLPEQQRWRQLPSAENGGGRDFDVKTAIEVLGIGETAQLGSVADAHKTQASHLLVAAVLSCLRGHGFWTRFDLELEAEREAPSVDISRTVGWLSSSRRSNIDLDADQTAAEVIRIVKDRINDATKPDDEQSYRAAAQVSVRYLGKIFEGLGRWNVRRALWSNIGGTQHEAVRVEAAIIDGSLHLIVSTRSGPGQQQPVGDLAKSMIESLRALIRDCLSTEDLRYTPSDFAAFKWTQADLDRISSALRKTSLDED
jgi:amino acid adenylation domain-containing protein